MEKKKIISIEDRIPKLKEARKKKANRRLLFYLSLFFILITIIVYLQSPLSDVQTIQVNGSLMVKKDDIIELSDINTSTNIWTINTGQAEQLIQNHPMINTVEVQRHFPQSVHITIEEYKVAGFIKEEETFLPILANGEIISEKTEIDVSEAPLLKNFSKEDLLERMAYELGETPSGVFDLISEISWEPSKQNKYKITLFMNDGFIVQTTIRNFSNRIKDYPSIVSQIEEGDYGIIHMGVGTYFEKIEE